MRRRVALKVIKLGMRVPFSLLFAVHSLSLAAAPPELPTTPAGKVLAGYLEALNSGNKNKLETFIKAHRPDRPNAVDIMLDLRWNTGGLDLYSIESSQPLNIQAVVLEREGGRYNRMSVSVTDANPSVITDISLMVIPPPPPGAPVPPPASAIGPRAVAAQVEDRSGSRTVAQSLRPARGNWRNNSSLGNALVSDII